MCMFREKPKLRKISAYIFPSTVALKCWFHLQVTFACADDGMYTLMLCLGFAYGAPVS
ncbi:hypothetical protein M758_2G199600 [Ceratodon purpureus]|uniref:Uncharacterized protein n=1 Tax=Ceratodon purpureus TaxID=3225 RepID=A0A8T0J0F7_CERPU|nr:hypothetical protein KC19_2G245200 [Ceratodon purpureus]KAG0627421.1 hypothetical protein M758_2G199600 [Ceratodon purpureus]